MDKGYSVYCVCSRVSGQLVKESSYTVLSVGKSNYLFTIFNFSSLNIQKKKFQSWLTPPPPYNVLIKRCKNCLIKVVGSLNLNQWCAL